MLQFSFLLHSLSSPALKSASNGLVSHSFSASYLLGSTIRQTTQSFLQSWAPVIFSMSPRQKGSLEIKILIKWPALPFFLRILSPGLNSHRQHNLPNVTELGTRNFFYVPTPKGIVGNQNTHQMGWSPIIHAHLTVSSGLKRQHTTSLCHVQSWARVILSMSLRHKGTTKSSLGMESSC